MPSRLESLEITLLELDPDILILFEHKMKIEELERLNLSQYKINSFCSRGKYKGGGVIILSKKQVKFKLVSLGKINEMITEKEFELCAAEFAFDSFQFVLLGVYRSPSSNVKNFCNKLEATLKIVCNKFKNVIIAGDLNINVLKDDNEHKLLRDTIKGYGIEYLVDFPTRITENSCSAIDNILINFNRDITRVTGINTQLSDHDGQMLEIFCRKTKIVNTKNIITKYGRKFSDHNISNFSKRLAQENWLDVFNSEVEHKYDVFIKIFMWYFNECFPVVKIRQRSSGKFHWYNEN